MPAGPVSAPGATFTAVNAGTTPVTGTIAVTGSSRGTRTVQSAFAYDNAGRMLSTQSASGTQTFTYDAGMRTMRSSSQDGEIVTRVLDAGGRLLSETDTAPDLAADMQVAAEEILYDGDHIEPWETVMTIEGDYTNFGHL